MSNKYSQPHNSGATRFSKSPMADVEFSRMTATPKCFTTFNAGDIVPIYCAEVLPHDTIAIDMDFVVRLQSAVVKPTMGTMQVDYFAFFVPNRIINESWKNVQGENTSGVWVAPEVKLAPLVPLSRTGAVQVPVGTVADYYGFPTQKPIPNALLAQCNDLKFRGYLEIYNHYFRDQNYEAPIPYSKLNIYNGFFDDVGESINAQGASVDGSSIDIAQVSDGSYPQGAIIKAVHGDGAIANGGSIIGPRLTSFSALRPPLKANKLHDAFTSGLPSPQKGPEVFFGVEGTAPVFFDTVPEMHEFTTPLAFKFSNTNDGAGTQWLTLGASLNSGQDTGLVFGKQESVSAEANAVVGSNLQAIANLSEAVGVPINDFRLAVATQQIYEILARGGSRYLSVLRSMFELDIDNPMADIPTQLGHVRKELDLYQVAQTSATIEGDSAQGDLAAFGYTSSNGHLFSKTFVEHGYIHIFAVVRHCNVYSTLLAPDNFRKSTLDFYMPPLANITEQPIRTAVLNPFDTDLEKVMTFQEAWWEYRYEPDRVSGEFRSGLNNGLDVWTYADPFDESFDVVDGQWLKSNSQEVLDRTLAVTSALTNQFLGMFAFKVDKQRPMPTYSVPGLDTI